MPGGANGEQPPSAAAAAGGAPPRPTITLPPRASADTFFGPPFAFSPGPMTLASSFFAADSNNNNDSSSEDCKSFSQLLAGAMASPVQSPMAMFGGLLSPSALLDSPAPFFSSPQGQFSMSHQQALAQVTAQAVQAHSNVLSQTEHSSSVSVMPATSLTQVPAATYSTSHQLMLPSKPDLGAAMTEPLGNSHSEQRLQPSSVNVDKPNDDGYNWRKYGQKQVKGSEFPRSYYKCTHPKCPVKKKVERSLEGHVTAIIYKGEHNHQRPHPDKLTKDNPTANSNMQGNLDSTNQFQSGSLNKYKEGIISHSMSKMDLEFSQATAEHVSGASDSEEVGDHENEVEERDDEPDAKRRNTEFRLSDPASSHRAVTESRIIVQTTSEVDLLDDGYRWRKYGQKVVKGNAYPRSYYKCTTPGCNVRKHVERASTDPKAVITTYEGKHNHGVPAAKTNSHTLANNSASQPKSQNGKPEKHSFSNRGVEGNELQPVARLRLKEEQIT